MSHEKHIQDLVAVLRDTLPADLLADAQRDPYAYDEAVYRQVSEAQRENIRRSFCGAKDTKCRARVAKSAIRTALSAMSTSDNQTKAAV